jgi:hypothetical protein
MPAGGTGHETRYMAAGSVVVAMDDPGLARVLGFWLKDALHEPILVSSNADGTAAGDVVITTPGDGDPIAAAELVARGVSVIVLAPVSRSEEGERYRRAGATYLAMSMDNNSALIEAVRAALVPQLPVIASRAAASHALSPKFCA